MYVCNITHGYAIGKMYMNYEVKQSISAQWMAYLLIV